MDEYPGYPTVALDFWESFSERFVFVTTVLSFVLALPALLLALWAPNSLLFFLLGAVVLVFHITGELVKEEWESEDKGRQTEFTSWREFFALFVAMGIVLSTILMIASIGAVGIMELQLVPAWGAWIFAAYYPIVDGLAARRKVPTPGRITGLAITRIIVGLFGFSRLTLDSIPFIGGNNRTRPGI